MLTIKMFTGYIAQQHRMIFVWAGYTGATWHEGYTLIITHLEGDMMLCCGLSNSSTDWLIAITYLHFPHIRSKRLCTLHLLVCRSSRFIFIYLKCCTLSHLYWRSRSSCMYSTCTWAVCTVQAQQFTQRNSKQAWKVCLLLPFTAASELLIRLLASPLCPLSLSTTRGFKVHSIKITAVFEKPSINSYTDYLMTYGKTIFFALKLLGKQEAARKQ